MNFNEALELLKLGKKVRRKEWEEPDYIMFNKIGVLIKPHLYKDGSWDWGCYCLDKSDVEANDWEEYKEPLLTEEEKGYLKMIIKFGDYHIRTIEKNKLCPSMHNRSYLIFNKCWGDANEPYDASSLFDVNKYFTGLEFGKEYTLKELGLED